MCTDLTVKSVSKSDTDLFHDISHILNFRIYLFLTTYMYKVKFKLNATYKSIVIIRFYSDNLVLLSFFHLNWRHNCVFICFKILNILVSFCVGNRQNVIVINIGFFLLSIFYVSANICFIFKDVIFLPKQMSVTHEINFIFFQYVFFSFVQRRYIYANTDVGDIVIKNPYFTLHSLFGPKYIIISGTICISVPFFFSKKFFCLKRIWKIDRFFYFNIV